MKLNILPALNVNALTREQIVELLRKNKKIKISVI
jgi:hypothetical protein